MNTIIEIFTVFISLLLSSFILHGIIELFENYVDNKNYKEDSWVVTILKIVSNNSWLLALFTAACLYSSLNYVFILLGLFELIN